jgi:hypothetical protein
MAQWGFSATIRCGACSATPLAEKMGFILVMLAIVCWLTWLLHVSPGTKLAILGSPVTDQSDECAIERIQAEVQEIAEVLSRRSGHTIVEVWSEALTLHRARYETKVIADLEEENRAHAR